MSVPKRNSIQSACSIQFNPLAVSRRAGELHDRVGSFFYLFFFCCHVFLLYSIFSVPLLLSCEVCCLVAAPFWRLYSCVPLVQ